MVLLSTRLSADLTHRSDGQKCCKLLQEQPLTFSVGLAAQLFPPEVRTNLPEQITHLSHSTAFPNGTSEGPQIGLLSDGPVIGHAFAKEDAFGQPTRHDLVSIDQREQEPEVLLGPRRYSPRVVRRLGAVGAEGILKVTFLQGFLDRSAAKMATSSWDRCPRYRRSSNPPPGRSAVSGWRRLRAAAPPNGRSIDSTPSNGTSSRLRMPCARRTLAQCASRSAGAEARASRPAARPSVAALSAPGGATPSRSVSFRLSDIGMTGRPPRSPHFVPGSLM